MDDAGVGTRTTMPIVVASPLPDADRPATTAPRWAVIGIFILMLIGALGYARAFLVPVLLGFLLTLVFSPIRRFLDRRGLPSFLSALLIVGSLVAVLAAGLVALSAPAARWIDDAPRIATQIERKLSDLRAAAGTLLEAGQSISNIAEAAAPNDAGVAPVLVRTEGQGLTGSLALIAPAVGAQTLFVLVLTFFLLASGDMIYEKIVNVMPTFRDKRAAMRIAYDIERRLSAYLLTITVINVCLGVAIGLTMWAIGLPNPALFAVIGFALNFVPYLGAMIGASLAVVVGLVSLDSVGDAALAGGSYFILTSLVGQFVTPFFVSRRLRVNAVVVFLSVAMCAWLWSIVGMLVATPLLVTVRTFCEHIPSLESVGTFLSARGAEQEQEQEQRQEEDAKG